MQFFFFKLCLCLYGYVAEHQGWFYTLAVVSGAATTDAGFLWAAARMSGFLYLNKELARDM